MPCGALTLEGSSPNKLNLSDIETIYATLDYFNVPGVKMIAFDLGIAKYKVYDVLGMWLQGKLWGENYPIPKDSENIFVARDSKMNQGFELEGRRARRDLNSLETGVLHQQNMILFCHFGHEYRD